MKKSNLLPALFAVMLAMCAYAETLVMGKAGDGESARSFYIATDWIREDGSVVNAAPMPGNDYIVANGYEMSVNATKTFAGDSLQFGHVGGNKGCFFHTGGGTEVTVQHLKLANGRYRVWQNKASLATGYLNGNVEVLSPAETPFLISPTHIGSATSYTIQWNANLRGEEGTGILIASLSNVIGEGTPRLVFNGDNSGYFGNIIVKDTNLTFCVTKASALGGMLTEFNDAALSLDEQCIFECSADSEILPASVKRGIKVKAGGAKIRVSSGKSLCVEWPISLEGKFEKVGGGTLVVDSAISGRGNGAFWVSEGAVSIPCAKTNVINSIVFSGGDLSVSYDSQSGACGVMELREWPVGKIKVRPPETRGIRIPFMRIPVSAGEVLASDFYVSSSLASSGLPSFEVVVQTEGDFRVAYLETAQIVNAADDASSLYALAEPSGWSDGGMMHVHGDYVLDVETAERKLTFGVGELSSLDDAVLSYAMPAGSSLAFMGDGSYVAQWLIRQKMFSGDIRAIGKKIEFIACGNTKATVASPYEESMGDLHVLKGRLYIDNNETSDGGLKIQVGCSRTLKIESEISGRGTMCLRTIGNNEAKRNCTYILSGTNSFNGRFFLYNAYDVACTNVFRFSDEVNLGPGATGSESYILLQAKSDTLNPQIVLYPIGSVKVNLPNRPLNFYSGSLNVKVDDGHVLEWDSLVKFRSGTKKNLTIVKKIGGGIWAIGGNVSLDKSDGVEDKWTLNVDEGYIRADNARAFSGMTVTFAEGAGVAAKYNPGSTAESAQYGMIVTDASRFTISGARLLVKVDTNGDAFFNKSLPVLTVPASAADVVGARLKGLCSIPMGGVSFVRESVTLDDAQYVRFSAEVHRGTVITVR